MKNALKKLLTALMILVSLTNIAWAGDTYTLGISCTIPAIPGVNAPLIEEEASTTNANTAVQQEANAQDEASYASEDTVRNEQIITEDQRPMVLVKTIYER